MALAIKPPYPPMEALLVDRIPSGKEWQYEPKWDGFRCIAFKDGTLIELQSKNCQSLRRYFPELVQALQQVSAERFVIDGEIVIPAGETFSFDDLLQRIHPAESRIKKLSEQHPAQFIVFDLLVSPDGRPAAGRPLAERRRFLERFFEEHVGRNPALRLSPATARRSDAEHWLESSGGVLDGVVAKRVDLSYQSGERSGMEKIKRLRTVDCVVGGFRYATRDKAVGSLLLGLYDHEGLLNHVGYTSSFARQEKKDLLRKIEPLIEPPGFTGNAPGGPSRWSTRRTDEWQPLRPELVAEVQYDHFTGHRFRHGTKFLRWRPDKAPRTCTVDQLRQKASSAASKLLNVASRGR
jgi:ATP-dependent DNA ligase